MRAHTYENKKKGKISETMRKTVAKISTSMFVLVMTLVILFSVSADAIHSASVYDPSGIKKLTSVDPNHDSYIDGSVMFELPSTVRDDEIISIIVMLENPGLLEKYDYSSKMTFQEYVFSDEANDHKLLIDSEKSSVLAKLDDAGISYETGADYASIFSGFEVLIEARDFKVLGGCLQKGQKAMVGEVYKPAETKLVENNVNVYETGIFNSSSFKYDGSGTVVAVLDTGLDYTHSAFSAANFPNNGKTEKLGLTKSEVAALIGDTNAAEIINGIVADDVYVSDKVPFMFDYADRDSDVYSIHNTHGTHVSGVIAGKDSTITGVAPNAQIVSMKVFSDTYEGARTSWILAALEDCAVLGVDAINMSLGSACGFSRESDNELMAEVYDTLKAKGISVVAAASNSYNSGFGSSKNGNLGLTSNPDSATVGSPSTYDAAMSVASINGVKTPYILYGETIIYFVEASDSASEEKNFFEDILPEGQDSIEMEYVLIPGVGRPADYTDMNLSGKIALVRRGDTTFEEKADAAQKAGAAGVIIYNNTSGDIRMNAGSTTIPLCSISQDDGEMLAAAKTGTLKISSSQSSGPFMSDFSSWGPTPDLKIKPEITAHGGNILSAVTGGEYDRLSGTSMACPNMAGAVLLLRQYVLSEPAFKAQITEDDGVTINYVEVTAIVNRLMMSTADIINNKNGLPYAVRKQGAGLANLDKSALTPAYIITYDRDNGSVMDKSKIELGDDPSKTGVYELSFSVYNFGNSALSYDISASVNTEGVSETLTYEGYTTVTEEGYSLLGENGAVITVKCTKGGSVDGSKLTVAAGATADVTVTITLSDSNKKYLNDSFKNGIYVEGYVILDAVSGTEVDLNAPFLAFYGDWTQAPMFDAEYFDTYKDELDESIPTLDKNLPDAYATRPIGAVYDDYINYLGAYYFIQNPEDELIGADKDHISISNAERSVHSLDSVWAGILRGAKKMVITITDDATGEVVFEKIENDVRKSYGDGGSIYPAFIDVEFDALEQNLKNNTTYTVKLQGFMDYGDGGVDTNLKNTFEFPLTTDFESPIVTDVEYYTEYDRSAKKTRLFAKIHVYDNHYAMALHVGYLADAPENSEYKTILKSFSNYLTPVYSQKDSTTEVVYELTDHIFDIKNNAISSSGESASTFAISCYDYAMNYSVYEIPLPDNIEDFYVQSGDKVLENQDEVSIKLYEVLDLTEFTYPATEWSEFLEYSTSSAGSEVISIVNNKVIGIAPGKATLVITDPKQDKELRIVINVLDEGRLTKPVADKFELIEYETLKAYYQLSSEDREIGEVGDIRQFYSKFLSFYPSESVRVRYKLDAYFPDDVEVTVTSGNEKVVKVENINNADGTFDIVAVGEGSASIAVRVIMDGRPTNFSETVRIEVKDPYIRTGPWLMHYFGNGGVVEIPKELKFTEIYQYAFSNYNYIPKDLEAGDEISEEDPNTTKIWYIGEDTITKVIIPEGVEKIGPYAFANLTALTEVVLPSTLKYIDYGAFYGCTALKKINLENVVTINKYAFQGCNLSGTVSLNSAHAIADYAFASITTVDSNGNEVTHANDISELIIPETLSSIGEGAFYGNEKLEKVTINAEKLKLGSSVFGECSKLTEISINASVIPSLAFYGCSSLETVTIGKDVNVIGEYAFAGTKIMSFNVDSANTVFRSSSDGKALLSVDGKTLLLAAPGIKGSFTMDDTVTAIGHGAFSGNAEITEVKMTGVTYVDKYAFTDCSKLNSVVLGKLEYIGDFAFAATKLTSIPALSSEIKEIGKYAFYVSAIESVDLRDYDGLTIGDGAFRECTSLKSVKIGDNAIIGDGAFMLTPVDENLDSTYKLIDGKRYFYYVMKSPLRELIIGKNAEIGTSAFYGAAELKSVTIGEGAKIGDMAFFNTPELTSIDLSGAVSIGSSAFSGFVAYLFSDNNLQNQAITTLPDGTQVYMLHYYAPAIKELDLSSATTIGEGAFQYCRQLEKVVLGEQITELSNYAFGSCAALNNINLGKVEIIGEGALSETALTAIDLSSATEIGKYAFVNSDSLESVTLNQNGSVILEGAFSNSEKLETVTGLNKATEIGDFAFAYTAVKELNLESAVSIGSLAFVKNEDEPVSVTLKLGEGLEYLGDNPFAMCDIAPVSTTVTETFNGKDYVTTTYTFDLNDNVKIIDGSIYRVVPYGLELITYLGVAHDDVYIPEGTVRLSAYSFVGSEAIRVHLPHSLNSIGHKAFFDCKKLTAVSFKSYEAPNLEEEFDTAYFNSLENFPGIGAYIAMTDGTAPYIEGLSIVPYLMIDAAYSYANVFYGANFVDYIGHAPANLVIVRPSNGIYYDTFIYQQYFSTFIDGGVAADDVTIAAIEAINKLPSAVQLTDEALVIAAREAYSKIALTEQQALVTNYSVLTNAEIRIEALKSALEEDDPGEGGDVTPPPVDDNDGESDVALLVIAIVEAVIILSGAGALLVVFLKKKKALKPASEELYSDETADEEDSDNTASEDENNEEQE